MLVPNAWSLRFSGIYWTLCSRDNFSFIASVPLLERVWFFCPSVWPSGVKKFEIDYKITWRQCQKDQLLIKYGYVTNKDSVSNSEWRYKSEGAIIIVIIIQECLSLLITRVILIIDDRRIVHGTWQSVQSTPLLPPPTFHYPGCIFKSSLNLWYSPELHLDVEICWFWWNFLFPRRYFNILSKTRVAAHSLYEEKWPFPHPIPTLGKPLRIFLTKVSAMPE